MQDHDRSNQAESDFRRRALIQSGLALMGGMVLGPAVLYTLAQSGELGTAETAPYRSSAVLLASLVGLIWGILRAKKARSSAMDGPGLLALALMFVGAMSAFTYVALLTLLWLGGSWLE
ncbi:MAG: hypothetical protein C0518_03365 [Opitutus sp.]|nr:hypothetical protein [Opitutus sp.]